MDKTFKNRQIYLMEDNFIIQLKNEKMQIKTIKLPNNMQIKATKVEGKI